MNITELAIYKKMFGGGSGASGASAYTVSSVDELPSDAVDGSMAIVKNNGMVGLWVFHGTIELGSADAVYNLDFYCPLDFEDVGQHYDSIKQVDYGYTAFSYCCNGEEIIEGAYDDGWGSPTTQVICITKEPTDTNAINLINSQANKAGTGYSLYTHENGEWVYKCEVA